MNSKKTKAVEDMTLAELGRLSPEDLAKMEDHHIRVAKACRTLQDAEPGKVKQALGNLWNAPGNLVRASVRLAGWEVTRAPKKKKEETSEAQNNGSSTQSSGSEK